MGGEEESVDKKRRSSGDKYKPETTSKSISSSCDRAYINTPWDKARARATPGGQRTVDS